MEVRCQVHFWVVEMAVPLHDFFPSGVSRICLALSKLGYESDRAAMSLRYLWASSGLRHGCACDFHYFLCPFTEGATSRLCYFLGTAPLYNLPCLPPLLYFPFFLTQPLVPFFIQSVKRSCSCSFPCSALYFARRNTLQPSPCLALSCPCPIQYLAYTSVVYLGLSSPLHPSH